MQRPAADVSETAPSQPFSIEKSSAIKIIAVFSVLMFIVAYAVWVERKVSAAIQDRRGPNRVGIFGLMQRLDRATWIAAGAKSTERVVYVFTDADCPYCNDLWKAMQTARAPDVQIRYLLVAVSAGGPSGTSAFLVYAIAYTLMTIGAFAVLQAKGRAGESDVTIDDLSGLATRHPWLAFGLAVCMLSLLGFPGTAGFIGKWYILIAVTSSGQNVLAAILVLTSVVSAGYYLPVIMAMYIKPEPDETAHLDVLASLGRGFLYQIADRLLRLAHPRLVHERNVLIERLDLALDDLLDHVLRLPFRFRLSRAVLEPHHLARLGDI